VIYVLAVGCSLGRALSDPEGIAVSPDGANVYAAVFASGALNALNRNASSGALIQKPRRPGCVVSRPTPDCLLGRRLLGASSVALSPDGRYLYSAAFTSDAIGVFKRVTKTVRGGRGGGHRGGRGGGHRGGRGGGRTSGRG
jgi:DNA-binding beta-propeller fold protein YncE